MERKTVCLLFRWVKPQYFILLMAVTTIASFIVGYSISVSENSVHYLFPYISNTGTTPPASCYFGLLLNLSAVFAAITMYFRHGFVEKLPSPTQRQHIVNDVALFLGGLSAFGIMLVANFQETNVLSIHLVGAFLAFVLGNVYCFMHNYITYTTIQHHISATKSKFCVRCFLSILSAIGLLLTITGGNIASVEAASDPNSGPIAHWNSEQKGYAAHLVSTFAEWVMGISFVTYFLTFYGDFKEIKQTITISIPAENRPINNGGDVTAF